ncbi:hypothetical protein [Flavobacterium sp.]|uniref:hypothetical protein n=1 Tax=Flavobacterium sp. TaxID=239 RepID=UPI0037514FFD
MKRAILFITAFFAINSFSQEHFAGLNTSSRVGIISGTNNPAELMNMSNKFEASILGTSFNVSNNKIGFNDILTGKNLETLIFTGNEPVNFRIDGEIYGPSFAMKTKNWAIAITSKASGKLDIVDVDTHLGDALVNSGLNSILGSTTINNDYNQRLNGTTWGEIGLSAATNLLNDSTHKVNIGATFKLLFPGSYSNLGLDKFNGTITNTAGQAYLNNTTANLNITYSGGLAESFSNFNDYSKSVFGSLNGFSGDIGINYQWKDTPESNPKKNQNKYKLNVGLSIKNIGAMTFKDDNNFSTNYVLNIQSTINDPQGLNLNQFENIDNLQQIETILINEGYLDKIEAEKKDFKVKLPTTISLYADVKLISSFYVTGFLQQKLNDNNANDQITAQNILTITPRFNAGFFEVFAPFSSSEISGFNTGLGFRVGGFYIGSGSIITALINDSKQADFYTGFRWAFL